MKVAILGTGAVGSALGQRLAAKGHDVVFGSRAPQSGRVQELLTRCGASARAGSPREAVTDAEVVVLALPWQAVPAVLAGVGPLDGRVLIDCTNPLRADLSGIEIGHVSSAAEQIAEWAPQAKVVKAFNTASVKAMLDPVFGGSKATMFYCGDDSQAKEIVGQLIADVGFEPVDAGPLSVSRYLEPLAMLYIHLAIRQGWGSNCAFKIMKR
jgi:NADPH-dependent F420 reductase